MQFKLKLTKVQGGRALPINYRYEFYNAVSRLIDTGIDQHPIPDADGFRMRVSRSFTFGRFEWDSYEVHHKEARIFHRGNKFDIETRFLIEDEEEGLVKKALTGKQIRLGEACYQISRIETVPPIDFQDVMTYRCTCPISLIKSCPSGDVRFLSPRDESFKNSLKIDLIKKLLRVHPEVSGLKDLDQYCPEFQFELLSEPKKKGFNIKTKGRLQSVVGYQFDFQLKASPVLHELGFYEGFGLPHSMGLGFVEVIA